MGIHKQTYRKYEGKLQGRANRIITIFKNEFMRLLKNIWVKVILLIAWGISIFVILTSGNFLVFFVFLFVWLLLFTSVAGGLIIAEDLHYNSITLYLSRPIQRLDYFLGKYCALFGLISLVSLLPNIVIGGFVIGLLYGSPTNEFDYYRFSYSLIGIGFFMTFVFTNIGIAFSTLTKNYKYAIGGIFTFLFFSNILALTLMILYEKIVYFSIWMNFMIIFSEWNGISDNSFRDIDSNISLGILLGISIVCILIAWIKIQTVELSE
jgi:ABC-type transport system involved in multi-copper enzyme maturation permease subunit